MTEQTEEDLRHVLSAALAADSSTATWTPSELDRVVEMLVRAALHARTIVAQHQAFSYDPTQDLFKTFDTPPE